MAVILAAGRGSRLYPLTQEIPKCLLPFGDRTLLDYQLVALQANGVQDVVIVVDHLAEKIYRAAKDRVKFVYRSGLAKTENLYSLWAARHTFLGRRFICLHADLLFHPAILKRALEVDADVVLAVDQELAEETMRVRVSSSGQILEIRKGLTPEEAYGTFLGLSIFTRDSSARLAQLLEDLVGSGTARKAFYTSAIEQLGANGAVVSCATTYGLAWAEIDTQEEYEAAKTNVIPAISVANQESVV